MGKISNEKYIEIEEVVRRYAEDFHLWVTSEGKTRMPIMPIEDAVAMIRRIVEREE